MFGQEFISLKLFDNLKCSPGLERDLLNMLELNPECFERHLSKVKKMNVSPTDNMVNMIRFLNLIEHYIGSQRRLKYFFERARNKILVQSSIARRLNTAGKPFFGKPLCRNEEIALLRDMTKEWCPSFLSTMLGPEVHDYLELPLKAKKLETI